MFNQIGGLNAVGAPLPSNQIGGESFVRHIGNDKLILDFHGGSGTTVHDKSHCGNDGTFGAGAAAPTWKRNELCFDGGDYITVADDDTLDITSEITLEAVLRVNNSAGTYLIFDKRPGTTEYNYYFRINSGYMRFAFYNAEHINLTDDTARLEKEIRSHLVCVYDRTDIKLYKDNTKIKSASQASIMIGDASDLVIGKSNYDSVSYLDGSTYILRIYNKVLSPVEIQQNYLVNKFGANN